MYAVVNVIKVVSFLMTFKMDYLKTWLVLWKLFVQKIDIYNLEINEYKYGSQINKERVTL